MADLQRPTQLNGAQVHLSLAPRHAADAGFDPSIVDELVALSNRLAELGTFTERAWFNNRRGAEELPLEPPGPKVDREDARKWLIADLTEAEALLNRLGGENDPQLLNDLREVKGTLSVLLDKTSSIDPAQLRGSTSLTASPASNRVIPPARGSGEVIRVSRRLTP